MPFKDTGSDNPAIVQDLKSSLDVKFRKKISKLITFLVTDLGLVHSFIVIYFYYVSYITAIPEKVVPDVVGLNQAEAEYILEGQSLNSLVVGARMHPNMLRV